MPDRAKWLPAQAPERRSGDPADGKSAVVPGAGQARGLWIIDQHPVDAKLRFEPLIIGEFEVVPSGLCGHLVLPCWAELGDLRHHCSVFDGVGKLTAFGQRAEAVRIFAGCLKVTRVEGEIGISGRVDANPREGLEPGVRQTHSRQLKVLAAGEQRALRGKHAGVDHKEKHGPSTDSGFDQRFSKKAAGEERHEAIDELEKTHGLERNWSDSSCECSWYETGLC